MEHDAWDIRVVGRPDLADEDGQTVMVDLGDRYLPRLQPAPHKSGRDDERGRP